MPFLPMAEVKGSMIPTGTPIKVCSAFIAAFARSISVSSDIPKHSRIIRAVSTSMAAEVPRPAPIGMSAI